MKTAKTTNDNDAFKKKLLPTKHREWFRTLYLNIHMKAKAGCHQLLDALSSNHRICQVAPMCSHI